MRVQYLSIITGACRARVASNPPARRASVFTRVHPVQPDHPFWTKPFIGVLFLYNFVILVGQVGHKNTVSHPTAITQSKDSSTAPIDAKSDLASIPHINTFDTFVSASGVTRSAFPPAGVTHTRP